MGEKASYVLYSIWNLLNSTAQMNICSKWYSFEKSFGSSDSLQTDHNVSKFLIAGIKNV